MPRKPSIWEQPAPYGTYQGARGSEDDWLRAFFERFSQTEIRQILGTRSPHDVLGIAEGATAAQVKAAYYRRARETHPDVNPGVDRLLFQQVLAAYQQLTPEAR